MDERTENLLSFMLDSPDGKYEVVAPTDEQLAAVLPWLINATMISARSKDYCDDTNAVLSEVLRSVLDVEDGDVRYLGADGYDCRGYDRNGFNDEGFNADGFNADGFNARGYDRQGYNRDGYNRIGRDRDGFDRDGRNSEGQSREEAAAASVSKWSDDFLEILAAKLKERNAIKEAQTAGTSA